MHSLSEGRFPRCARNEKGRRSSQKFPESTSLQLAAPGSFDSVVACAPTPLKMTEGKMHSLWEGRSLAALGMKRGGDHRRNSLNQHRCNWLHRIFRLRRSDALRLHSRWQRGNAFTAHSSTLALAIKRRRSSQKFPESTSLQLAAPGSFDSVVACAPTPLKMTEGKCIRCGMVEAMP
jgi:hypothetical protein